MKRVLLAGMLASVTLTANAAPAGGEGCGWGNLLFEGQKGKSSHVLGLTTNGSSGNNTFGVTSGTNGCSSSGVIKYGGKEMMDVSAVMDEFSEDVARGDGEVISAVAVSLGITPEDRPAFKAAMHDNFTTIFPSQDVTAEQVMAAMLSVMREDDQLAKYVS